MKKCRKCGEEIPEARLKALPNTETCVNCSGVQKKAGFPMVTGKTEYTDLQIVDRSTYERLMQLQERKGYGIAKGVKFDSDKNKDKVE